jgi:hypothetical protein
MIPSDLGSLPGGGCLPNGGGASSLPGLDSLPVDPTALLGGGLPSLPSIPGEDSLPISVAVSVNLAGTPIEVALP